VTLVKILEAFVFLEWVKLDTSNVECRVSMSNTNQSVINYPKRGVVRITLPLTPWYVNVKMGLLEEDLVVDLPSLVECFI